MAKDNEVKAVYTADTKGFEKGTDKVAKKSGALEGVLKKLGPVGGKIQGVIDGLGVSSLGAATGVGVAAAAVGAASKIITDAIGQWAEFVSKIDDYQDVTGQSAEASSRQVVAFEELGVSAEVAGAGMFKLSKEISGGAKNLAEYGIEVAKSSDGTTDLNGTLINIMNAYQGASDAAEKNAIVMAAFGKSGAAMIPILETNTAELARLEKQVGKVVTDQDIADVRAYRISQQELKHSTDELGLSLGQIFLPAAKSSVEAINENIYVQKRLAEHTENTTRQIANLHYVNNQLTQQLKDEYQAAKAAQEQTDRLAAATKAAADEAEREAEMEKRLTDAIHGSLDASLNYRQAKLDLVDAQKKAAEAHGKDAEANLRLEKAYIRVADSAVEMRVQQALARGETLSQDQQTQIWIQTLEGLIKKLDKNSPLRKELQGYINQLASVPRDISTSVSLTTPKLGTARAKKNLEFAEGGVVPGPVGAPVEATVHGGETVVPVGKNVGSQIHIHMHGMVIDGPAMDRFFREGLRRARAVPGT